MINRIRLVSFRKEDSITVSEYTGSHAGLRRTKHQFVSSSVKHLIVKKDEQWSSHQGWQRSDMRPKTLLTILLLDANPVAGGAKPMFPMKCKTSRRMLFIAVRALHV